MSIFHLRLLACVATLLGGCAVPDLSHRGAHFFWESKLQEVAYIGETKSANGTTKKRRAWYIFTPSRSGNTKETAVKMYCYNMISGGNDEQHLLKTKFPNATWETWEQGPTTVKSDHRYYHVYHVNEPDGGTHLFWINATDYHDFF